MTAFRADMLAADEPDHLAGSLLRTLGDRLTTRAASWSFLKTLIWSTSSFGIAPLIAWPLGMRRIISLERLHFINLAEWMRLRSGNPNSMRLSEAADRVRSIGLLSYGPVVIASIVGLIVFGASAQSVKPFEQLKASTFHFGRSGAPPLGPAITNNLFYVWTAGLTVAFIMHWLQLVIHAANVRHAVRAFNDLAAVEGLPSVREPRGIGLRPIWLAAALIMMTANAVWAIPMMLAGGMQRRYVDATSPALRSAVADHLRSLLLIRRPVMRVPTAVSMPRRCPNERCRSTMARIANFCPRCGKHVGPEIDQLA